jgi:hypothetical protein
LPNSRSTRAETPAATTPAGRPLVTTARPGTVSWPPVEHFPGARSVCLLTGPRWLPSAALLRGGGQRSGGGSRLGRARARERSGVVVPGARLALQLRQCRAIRSRRCSMSARGRQQDARKRGCGALAEGLALCERETRLEAVEGRVRTGAGLERSQHQDAERHGASVTPRLRGVSMRLAAMPRGSMTCGPPRPVSRRTRSSAARVRIASWPA